MDIEEVLKKATARPWGEYTLCALRSVEEDEANEELSVLAVNAFEADRDLIQKLTETLETIADFAPGNGDVCEIIAKRARAALAAAKERR